MRTQTSAGNTVNDLRYEIKFEDCVKGKSFSLSKTLLFFLERKYVLFSETYFFKITKKFVEADTKKHGYVSQKPQMLQW